LIAEPDYRLGVVCALDEHRALADYYLYEAAKLYLEQENREGALETYGYLKSLRSPLAVKVYNRLYP
jgi:hypothetical protein